MPLTKNREVDHLVDQETRTYAVAASTQIFKGAFVGLASTGYARPLVAGDPFVGIAYGAQDNSAGSNGDKDVQVYTLGDFSLALSGAVVGDLGRPVFASADDTLTFDGDGNSYVGVVKGIMATATIALRLDADRKLVKTVTHAVENLGAGVDIAARAIHACDQPAWAVAARVINQATAAAGIDAGNTCVVKVSASGGTIASETFDDVTAFPAANTKATLGALTNTQLPAGEVVKVTVTNGATADPGTFLVELDYV